MIRLTSCIGRLQQTTHTSLQKGAPMIRAMVALLGILMLTGACSPFGHTPTSVPPIPHTATPASTPTPSFEWEDLFFRCSITAYNDNWTNFNLYRSEGVYVGNFFLTHVMARARVILQPPDPLVVWCGAIDSGTYQEWDRTQRLQTLNCTLASIHGPGADHEFKLTDYGPDVLYEYRSSTFYLDLALASRQVEERGLFQMQVACTPGPVY